MKQHKYRAKPQIIDGVRFASKLEAGRWQELKLLEQCGQIRDLNRQVRFPLWVRDSRGKETLVCHYVADATYIDSGGGNVRLFAYLDVPAFNVVEDVKGVSTDIYRLKKKLMKALYGIDIVEIRKGRRAA